MGGHSVCWHNPRALAQLVSKCELIVVLVGLGVEPESDEWETLSALLGHDYETQLLERVGEIIGCTSEVSHDGTVTMLAKTDELVILTNDLGCTLGEVKGKGCLIGAQVVDIEDELLWEELRFSPDDPAHTGVDEPIPVPLSVKSTRRNRELWTRRTCGLRR